MGWERVWIPAWYARDDQWRLRGALAFSLFLHGMALFVPFLPESQRSLEAGGAKLDVSVAKPTVFQVVQRPIKASIGLIDEAQNDSSTELLSDQAQLLHAKEKPDQPIFVKPRERSEKIMAERSRTFRSEASEAELAGSGYSVTMLVTREGRVTEIYWGQLPALTDEQFELLERMVRERRYPDRGITNNGPVVDTIDVRGLLGLPSAPSLNVMKPVSSIADQGREETRPTASRP
jgi:hypothetical protein